MHKTILVPIDFRVESLNTLKFAIEANRDSSITVVLLHCEQLDDSITELLFYSPIKTIIDRTTPEFNAALAILRNKFESTIREMTIRLFHADRHRAFTQFLKGNKVDEIYIPATYPLKFKGRAFDPFPLIEKSGLPVYKMAWEESNSPSEKDQIESLFNH